MTPCSALSCTRPQVAACSLVCLTILRPWRGRRSVPPKRRVQLYGLHGVISQKMILFKTTAVKTSNPTKKMILKTVIFWNVTLCSLVKDYRRFGRTFCLHLQGGTVSRESSPQDGGRTSLNCVTLHKHKVFFVSVRTSHPTEIYKTMSRDSSVGIGTGYGLDGRGVGVRVPVRTRRPDRFWVPFSLLSNEYQGSFPWDKVARAWTWPLTSSSGEVKKMWTYTSTPPYAFMA
jgi:hypothetical protein